MLKPTPAVARATRVLDVMAARPFESFTLTELAAAVQISPTSALSILHALEAAGYVRRHPVQKTYVLGPALLVLGDGARAQHRLVDAAVAEIEFIAAEAHAECSIGVVAGDDILVVGLAGRPAVDTADARVGERVPYRPPLGAALVAWRSDVDIDGWIRRARPTHELQLQLREALAEVRRRGFAITRESEARIRFGSAMRRLVDQPDLRLDDEATEQLFAELAGGLVIELHDDDAVSTVSAPVFGGGRDPEMQLTLQGLPRGLRASQVHALGERLRAGAHTIERAASSPPRRAAGGRP
jgi:DNA-binding IclR family transcriptional regulator